MGPTSRRWIHRSLEMLLVFGRIYDLPTAHAGVCPTMTTPQDSRTLNEMFNENQKDHKASSTSQQKKHIFARRKNKKTKLVFWPNIPKLILPGQWVVQELEFFTSSFCYQDPEASDARIYGIPLAMQGGLTYGIFVGQFWF